MVNESIVSTKQRRFIDLLLFLIITAIIYIFFHCTYLKSPNYTLLNRSYRQRPGCSCARPELFWFSSNLRLNPHTKNQPDLCSKYATYRGPNQRIISISLFGPIEKSRLERFQLNRTLTFLGQLIKDMNKIYSDDFILRVHHDNSINLPDVICPIECENPNVDFCNMTNKRFMPERMWRFIAAGDPLVDIMLSRDLDSPLTPRERAAVDAWLSSNKSFHSMRDHRAHWWPMLAGMWGFRPSLNRTMSRIMHEKIHNRTLMQRYGGRGDQPFLWDHIWGPAKSSIVVHASFHCNNTYGQKPEPFPTQRPPVNETNCFVGCVRPCCKAYKSFPECPKECRPKDHQEWKYC